MTPQEAHRRARELWARLPTQRIGQQLEPLVVAHVELVRKTMVASPPAQTAYCLALNPQQQDEETDEALYAYGWQTDREQLLADSDTVSVWNATLFDDFIDAVEPKPITEHQIRAKLNDQDVVSFDYWLLCEVARRLNELGAAPADRTSDFVVYHFEHENSADHQLGLAYSLPESTYTQLADQGLVFPDQAVHGVNWLDFGLEPEYDLGPDDIELG
jgi:hypothetical protein